MQGNCPLSDATTEMEISREQMLPSVHESIEQGGGKESNRCPQCQMECLEDAKMERPIEEG